MIASGFVGTVVGKHVLVKMNDVIFHRVLAVLLSVLALRLLYEGVTLLGWLCSLVRRLGRSEEHTSELQSLMRTSYAVLCLKKKNPSHQPTQTTPQHNSTSPNI